METGAASSVRRGLRLGVVGTSVSSCCVSSLAVVEFDTLSIDRREKISSRVDALIGRIEKREESAVARRVEPLENVEGVAAGGGMWDGDGVEGRDGSTPATALELDEGGGKNERLVRGILRTTDGRSKLGFASGSERERE